MATKRIEELQGYITEGYNILDELLTFYNNPDIEAALRAKDWMKRMDDDDPQVPDGKPEVRHPDSIRLEGEEDIPGEAWAVTAEKRIAALEAQQKINNTNVLHATNQQISNNNEYKKTQGVVADWARRHIEHEDWILKLKDRVAYHEMQCTQADKDRQRQLDKATTRISKIEAQLSSQPPAPVEKREHCKPITTEQVETLLGVEEHPLSISERVEAALQAILNHAERIAELEAQEKADYMECHDRLTAYEDRLHKVEKATGVSPYMPPITPAPAVAAPLAQTECNSPNCTLDLDALETKVLIAVGEDWFDTKSAEKAIRRIFAKATADGGAK
jgi:hypothetical protein